MYVPEHRLFGSFQTGEETKSIKHVGISTFSLLGPQKKKKIEKCLYLQHSFIALTD